MLNSRRNRAKHGAQDCVYGCCTTLDLNKDIVRRILRRREKARWNQELKKSD